MRNLAKLIAVFTLCAASAGCARIAVHYESEDGLKRRAAEIPTRIQPEQAKAIVTPGKPLPSRTFTTGIFGVKSFSAPVDISSECPDGWGQFTTRVTGLQALFHVITLNLYSPWTVDTACRASIVRPIN